MAGIIELKNPEFMSEQNNKFTKITQQLKIFPIKNFGRL